MKQKLLNLTRLRSLLLLACVMLGVSAWGETKTGTINFGSASGSTPINKTSVTGVDNLGNTWTITTVMSQTSFTQNANYSQIGSSNNPATSITFTTTLPANQTINSFSAKFGGFSGTAGTVNLKVGDTTVGTGALNASTDVTVSNTSNQAGTVLTVTVTDIAKGVKAYFISYSYDEVIDEDPHTVTFGDDNSTMTETGGGVGITLPSRSNVGNYAFVGWSATNITVETTTAPTYFAAGAVYHPIADITLYPIYQRSGFTTNSVNIGTYANANNWENDKAYETVTIAEGVVATASTGGNTGKYYSNGQDWRFYQSGNGKLTISSATEDISSVKLTFTPNNNGVLKYGDSEVTSNVPLTVSGKSVELSVGNSTSNTNGQIRITAIEVTVGAASYISTPSGVEDPVFSIESGSYTEVKTVSITCGTQGASIYYTLNGAEPTEESTLYTEALTVSETTTIKAIAIKDGNSSNIVTATYTINLPAVAIEGAKFVKVTSTNDITDGQYLIVYEGGEVAFNGGLSTLDAAGNTIAVAINNGEIAANSENITAIFTVSKTSNGTTIKSASGKFIGRTTNENGLDASETTEHTNTITIDNGNVVITSSGNPTLRYNSAANQNRFRYYKSGQQAIQLYKYVETANVTVKGWATYITKNNVKFAEGDAYVVTNLSSSGATTIQGVTSVPANTPVLLKSAGEKVASVLATAPTAPAKNLLKIARAGTTIPAGCYVLSYTDAKGVGFYHWTGTAPLTQDRVYLQPEEGFTPNFIGINPGGENGIENVSASSAKNSIFDLQGRSIVQPTKGLYIVNGKKVVIK